MEKKIRADKLSRKLNTEFNQQIKRARKNEQQLEQQGARLDQFQLMKNALNEEDQRVGRLNSTNGLSEIPEEVNDTAIMFAE